MKYTLWLGIFLTSLLACQKQDGQQNATIQQSLQSILQEKLQPADYRSLDLDKLYPTRIDSAAIYITRIGLKGKDIAHDYVLIRTDAQNRFLQGCIIHQQWNKQRRPDGYYSFNGFIHAISLNRDIIRTTNIQNNHLITGNLDTTDLYVIPGPPQPPMPEPPPPILFPYNDEDDPLLDFIRYLESISGNGPSNSLGGGYYWPATPPASSSGRPQPEEPLFLEQNYDGGPGIEFTKFAKCFDNISSVNAHYSISLLVDVPINNKPWALIDWQKQFPGHTFIQLKKANGNQEIIQNIGFYPATSFKSLSLLSVGSKVTDDSQHEFNASITMNVSADHFAVIMAFIPFVMKMRYDMVKYNCTDFAVDIFNLVRKDNPLYVPQIVLPNYVPGQIPRLSSTPQELYKLLEKMKTAGGSEAVNISIYPSGKRAEEGHGPCE